jgi:hypothetical protein
MSFICKLLIFRCIFFKKITLVYILSINILLMFSFFDVTLPKKSNRNTNSLLEIKNPQLQTKVKLVPN